MMTIYTPPSAFCGPLQSGLVLVPLSVKSPASAFNPNQLSSGPTAEFWRAEVDLPSRKDAAWRETSAFLMKLRGGLNKVRLYDPYRPLRGAGGVASTVNVYGDFAKGVTSITFENMLPSEAQSLLADDMFGIADNLYIVTSNATSDANGRTTVSFLPPLRKGAADGDAVSLNKPTGLFVLTGGLDGLSASHTGFSSSLSLSFFEEPDFD